MRIVCIGVCAAMIACVDENPHRGLTANMYCERTVDFFCDFYLRCGRMAVATKEECREVFLETCNARYEPVYVNLVEAGLLDISPSGVDVCRDHLASVACAEQIRDLQGPCTSMWVGLQKVGGPCGFNIESFVCEPDTRCVLSLSLCGTCKPVAAAGDACGADVTCASDASCDGGTCKLRAQVGDTCSGTLDCVLGARCDQTCQPPTFVGVAADCDSTNRCQYSTSCVGGTCVKNAMLGHSCDTQTPCDSGFCGH